MQLLLNRQVSKRLFSTLKSFMTHHFGVFLNDVSIFYMECERLLMQKIKIPLIKLEVYLCLNMLVFYRNSVLKVKYPKKR